MRWFVEVSRVGDSALAERYCVEAKAWQAALQETRKLRGDSGPLSKFSIELLDDGYRAVDPVQKIRYLVNQAPGDAPLVMPQVNGSAYTGLSASTPPGAGPSTPPSSTAATIVPAAPVAVSAVPTTAPVAKKVMGVLLGASNSGIASGASSSSLTSGGAPRPSPRRSGANPTQSAKSVLETKATELAIPVGVPPAPAPEPTPAAAPVAPAPVVAAKAKAPAEARAAGVPAFEVVSSRIQEPAPEAPIVYRELACVVAPGTSREAVEALLRDRLKSARADFSARPPGQLVQIAVFDHAFEERPLRAPLGTLAWKDWRGEPILGYPAFGEAAPPPTASLPPGPVVAALAEPAAAAGAASAAEPPAVVAAATSSSSKAASEEAEQPVLLRRPASRPDSDRGSRPRIGIARRRAGEDLISELFESMHELHFARDIARGADFVLGVIEQVIPCEATLVQVFDINTRNFVVVRGRGAGAQRAVLHRTPDNDPLTSEIMRRERARAYRTEGDPRFASGRWGVVGLALTQVLCGAVRQGGRYLGMIELANPLGGAPFHETEINALDYICEQFADFVASRPVVLDPDVILGR